MLPFKVGLSPGNVLDLFGRDRGGGSFYVTDPQDVPQTDCSADGVRVGLRGERLDCVISELFAPDPPEDIAVSFFGEAEARSYALGLLLTGLGWSTLCGWGF